VELLRRPTIACKATPAAKCSVWCRVGIFFELSKSLLLL
jgi:hypothetical protein